MSIDFCLPEYNIAIECQGGQHFGLDMYNSGIERYIKQLIRDAKKFRLCVEHSIPIIYYSREKVFEYILTTTEEVLNEIKKYGKKD